MNAKSHSSKDNQPPLISDQELVSKTSVFDAIFSDRLEASFVYRDDKVAAIMDIQPINHGHVLVIPIRQARFLNELDAATAGHLFNIGCRIAGAIRSSGIPCEGVNMLLADGASAGQEVPHVHLHVFPRFAGDGFGFKHAERYFTLPPRAELEAVAGKIRDALED